MIFITAKFRIKPEHADDWPSIAGGFTQATRAEEGCLWFDWSRSDDAAASHVQSAHFAQAQAELPGYLVETPRIVNFAVPGDDWSELGELAVKD